MQPRSRRLHFLDGLRGLAAAYVLLYHEVMINDEVPGELSGPMTVIRELINHGSYSVIVFIVLSGFSLMMPVASSEDRKLPGGLRGFVRRRARRILPPYYAALILSMVVILAYNTLGRSFGMHGAAIEGALDPGPVISHFLLVHNLTFDWAYRINAPMWTVSTEWQIYFVFALALLPLWRRAGIWVTLLAAVTVGCLPYFLLPEGKNFFWACPWFLGCFTLGMTGAVVEFSPQYQASWLRNKMPWSLATLLALGAVVLATPERSGVDYLVQVHLVSLFAVCIIGACATFARQNESHFFLRFLRSPAIVSLGGFSYSLYLIQHPMLKLIEKGLLRRLPLGKEGNLIFQLLVVTPFIMAIAWVFADLFERPWTTGAKLLPAVRQRLGLASKGSAS